jgi:riboflavin kinase/FMN adenylyltransferase
MIKIFDLQTQKEYALRKEDKLSCAIGNFDGVHAGHQKLLSLAAQKSGDITKSAVFTFSVPTSRLKNGTALLTSPEERYPLFRDLELDLLILADFEDICTLSHEQFAEDILFRQCQVTRALCGFNFRYGKSAKGTAETLKDTFAALGGTVEVVSPYRLDGHTVSSSEIREALSVGNAARAHRMLTRPYSVTAEIVHGKQLGRTLGFPTANQRFPADRLVPKFGVYAVRVHTEAGTYFGVANVGVRPTVEHTVCANCEVYLLDFEGDLYGRTVKTDFLEFLRPERHFSDLNALICAVQNDIYRARQYFQAQKDTLSI